MKGHLGIKLILPNKNNTHYQKYIYKEIWAD